MARLLYDSVNAAAVTGGMAATAGYVDGKWPNSAAMKAAHPNLPHVSIAAFARDDADALDCEPGDATIAQAPAWVDRQHARGVALPIVYTSASNITALRSLMGGRKFLLWSAHYTSKPHICGGCGYPGADATQFANHGPNGENVDQTLMSDQFFAAISGSYTPTSGAEMTPAETNALLDNIRSIVMQEAAHVSVSQGYAGAAGPLSDGNQAIIRKIVSDETAHVSVTQGYAGAADVNRLLDGGLRQAIIDGTKVAFATQPVAATVDVEALAAAVVAKIPAEAAEITVEQIKAALTEVVAAAVQVTGTLNVTPKAS